MELQPFSDSSESSALSHIDYPRQLKFENVNMRTSYESKHSPINPALPMSYPPGDLCDMFFLCRRPYRTRRVGLNDQMLGVIWFVRDTCGIICLMITWMLILYAEFVVSAVILVRSPGYWFCLVNGFIYHFLAFMAVASHFKAFSTDPGTIPLGVTDGDMLDFIKDMYGYNPDQIPKCTKCVSIKPPRVHHCRVCSRCVHKMDHHCPWINNCVGEANQKFFVLFTFYICLMSFFAIYMCIHFFIQCTESEWEACQVHKSSTLALLFDFSPAVCCCFTLGLIMESIIFGLFTFVMCISQVCSMTADETKIERLQGSSNPDRATSRYESFTAVCGSRISMNWFNPFSSSSQTVFPHGRWWNAVNYRTLLKTGSDAGSSTVWEPTDDEYPGGKPSMANSRNTILL